MTDPRNPTKWVYAFGDGAAEGSAGMKNLLGGKGANLAEMSALGLPVPPGFTLTTEVCSYFYAHAKSLPEGLTGAVEAALAKVESQTNKKFGDPANPLLVSVRSGARASMPGMMDTVLNLGLNDSTVQGLIAAGGDSRFAFDSYRRFIQMFGHVVMGVDHHEFEDILEEFKRSRAKSLDTELTAEDWQAVISDYKKMIQRESGRAFPDAPHDQLWAAISAVFTSWMNPRACTYRRLHDIPESWGTAVNVQAMVFGNRGTDCATGVAFTRNPNTGENQFFGEYLINAQGEDVVAGIRTPQPLTRAARAAEGGRHLSLEEAMPDVFSQLLAVRETLERHYRDMQDIEFTVEHGRLYMLQTRAGKRSAAAALKIAVEMVADGLISEREAVARIEPQTLDQLLHPTLDPKADRVVIARGLPASPGAANGRIVFSAEEAERLARNGEAAILVRVETSPEDIHGMHAARGILTTRGGMTSHAAVVARGMGRPCVAGAGELRIDYAAQTLIVRNTRLKAGDTITIDGSSGQVMLGAVPTLQPELSGDFAKLMEWADGYRRLRVRANAETPLDAETARRFGAEGIGLCRTEHMFFDAERILFVRQMILADSESGRRAALARLAPIQRQDFIELFTIMQGLPVTIRLLDPPLHEFLPHADKEIAEVAAALDVDPLKIRHRVLQLSEANPMLGHRGCRLGITYPEIYEMQVRAIFEATAEVARTSDSPVTPEIMIPLIATARELEILKKMVDRVAAEVSAQAGRRLNFLLGTMIELPRAALMADEIAESAEFFSFGTNDLTQTTFGISRDDAGGFVPAYIDAGIFERDPFTTLDTEGVGRLMRIAADGGRRTRSAIKLGICGEHGGDPASIHFCEELGLDYVSCSPYRVPIARLAAAQAVLSHSVPIAATA